MTPHARNEKASVGHHMKIKSNESKSNELESLSRGQLLALRMGFHANIYTYFFSDPILEYRLVYARWLLQAKS